MVAGGRRHWSGPRWRPVLGGDESCVVDLLWVLPPAAGDGATGDGACACVKARGGRPPALKAPAGALRVQG